MSETKVWLANTLRHFYKRRKNKFDLLWDIANDDDVHSVTSVHIYNLSLPFFTNYIVHIVACSMATS